MNNFTDERSTAKRKAFLDLLMELSNEGTKFTDEELREEVDTMMIAVRTELLLIALLR